MKDKELSLLNKALRVALLSGVISTSMISANTIAAEADTNFDDDAEVIQITGSRIKQPGMVSASPILTISGDEIEFQQEAEIESIIRSLPAVIPGDGRNVNNGTAGAATIDLRGLGPQRNLILLNGRRMVPFNFNGQVDSATIPTALLERVDILTGGASTVYGSDAIAGAINFVLKSDFEGVVIDTIHSQTGESDGDTDSISLTVGGNFDQDRGNAAISMSWYNRDPVLLGQRPLGLLGIDTADGSNLDEFLAGQPPAPPTEPNCDGPFVVESGGSSTAIPTRFSIVGGGAGTSGQFRTDRTLGSNCSRFNFNPFNYYQTPSERYSATAIAHYDFNDNVTAYSTLNFTNTSVVQQVAPSGTFGQTFNLPLANSFIGDQARQFMIDAGNTALANGNLNTPGNTNWQDVNNNGVVDAEDYLLVQLRRRTLELGPRTEIYETNQFQFLVGAKGDLSTNWDYDVSFSYGESNRVTTRDGYTNLVNIQNALDSVDGVTCANGDPNCVPIDLFGGFGTITPEMAAYARAIALQTQGYEQSIGTIVVNGLVDGFQLPTADTPLAVSFGYETRTESAFLEPDECLKLAPSSCQGGAGGNLLPIKGGYKVDEFFVEGFLPIFEGKPFAELLNFEFGFRSSDYDTVGNNNTWKAGLNWRPVDQLLFRAMQQQATRAPNVGELSSPVTTALANALLDPCSIANAGNIDATLEALCISTGMVASQVGSVQDIISGQINAFAGSNPNAPPDSETADTTTLGVVWSPDFEAVDDFSLSVDYYDIDIEDIIGNFSAQEVLDACYKAGDTTECAKINRIGGDLTISGSGINLFTTNLDFLRAEGIEVAASFNVDLADGWGRLKFSGVLNKYLTQESQSSAQSAVIDCKGFFGTSCDPISELRWTQRTTWDWNDLTVSAQWRHIDSVSIEPPEKANVDPRFHTIDDYDYIDLFASYVYEDVTFSLGITNAFDDDPPVVGNEAGDTSSNSGNTFPSNYDTLGRVYRFGVRFEF